MEPGPCRDPAAVWCDADRARCRRDPATAPDRTTERQEATVAETDTETYSGEFYCVKCKAKREASGYVVVNDKGTRMAKATCPVCSTNLNRILGKA
jgi:hypothetical protein